MGRRSPTMNTSVTIPLRARRSPSAATARSSLFDPGACFMNAGWGPGQCVGPLNFQFCREPWIAAQEEVTAEFH
jgi:hypothetical protein